MDALKNLGGGKMNKPKDYLVSKGLVPLLVNRYGLQLSNELKERIRELEDEFAQTLGGILQCKSIFGEHPLSYRVLDDESIINSVRELLEREKRPKISFDDVYFQDLAEDFYSITRLTNPDEFSDKRVGPRPGFPELQTQRERLANRFRSNGVVFLDIGIFEGETLMDEVDKFREIGVNVERVVLAIGNTEYVERMRKKVPVDVANIYDFGEWIEIRDFFGFDGRKPIRDNITGYSNEILIIPYKENLGTWASIPKGLETEVKKLCEQSNRDLINELRREGIDVTYRPVRDNANGTQLYLIKFDREK